MVHRYLGKCSADLKHVEVNAPSWTESLPNVQGLWRDSEQLKSLSRPSASVNRCPSPDCVRSLWTPSVSLAHLVSPEPPEWVFEPEGQLSMIGSDVLIKCAASGAPQPRITWRVNGELLTGQSLCGLRPSSLFRTFALTPCPQDLVISFNTT